MLLHHRSYGEGQPLIILHGFLGSGSNWHTLSSRTFAKYFEVYAVDLRNHGRSPHREEFDYRSMADDVEAFILYHALPPVLLMGHSMGGMTAMHVALTYPDILEKLIVVDIAPRRYESHYTNILKVLGSLNLSHYRDRRSLNAALRQEIPSEPLRQLVLQNILFDREAGLFEWKVNLEGIIINYEQLNRPLPSGAVFNNPVLFLRGGDSDYIRDDDEDTILSFFPAADIVTVPNAGHWIHVDTPRAFADTVVAFMLR